MLLLPSGGGRYSTTEPPALLMVTWGAVEAELGRCSRGGAGSEMGCGMCSSRSLQNHVPSIAASFIKREHPPFNLT